MKVIMLVLWGGAYSLHPYSTYKACQEEVLKFTILAELFQPEEPYHFQCFKVDDQ